MKIKPRSRARERARNLLCLVPSKDRRFWRSQERERRWEWPLRGGIWVERQACEGVAWKRVN